MGSNSKTLGLNGVMNIEEIIPCIKWTSQKIKSLSSTHIYSCDCTSNIVPKAEGKDIRSCLCYFYIIYLYIHSLTCLADMSRKICKSLFSYKDFSKCLILKMHLLHNTGCLDLMQYITSKSALWCSDTEPLPGPIITHKHYFCLAIKAIMSWSPMSGCIQSLRLMNVLD